MHYAIVLYLDDEKTAMVKETVKALAPVCGSDYCLGIEPHITVSAIVADAEEPVRKEAERLNKALKKGKIQIGSIGVFNPLVLFLAPVVDSYLTEACRTAKSYMLKVSEIGNQGRYMPDHWVPHMAVAMKMERAGLYRGFQRLSEIFTPFCAEIDKMALIKWEEDRPYQELAVYALS
jgi:2'-5' RNA ligase